MKKKSTSIAKTVSRTAVAVFELIRSGGYGEAHRALFPRELRELEGAGLVALRDGKYAPTNGARVTPPEPEEVMTTKVVRLPANLLAQLDAEAKALATGDDRPNVSAVMRRALEIGLPAVVAERSASRRR